MVRMPASENAVQRGTTTAASLDAIAGLTKLVVRACWNAISPEEVCGILQTSLSAAQSIWGKVRQGEAPGRHCNVVSAAARGQRDT